MWFVWPYTMRHNETNSASEPSAASSGKRRPTLLIQKDVNMDERGRLGARNISHASSLNTQISVSSAIT